MILEAGNTVEVSDLFAEGFDPTAGRHDFTTVADPSRFHYQTEQDKAAAEDGFAADLRREQDRLSRADLVIFAFPLWWGGLPAILKAGSNASWPMASPMSMGAFRRRERENGHGRSPEEVITHTVSV